MPNSSVFARLFIVILVVAATFATDSAQAQSWSGIIDGSRATDWSQAGVPGGIPSGANYTQCGATITGYSGDASIINTAIQNCSGADATHPKYVLLGSGTFNI